MLKSKFILISIALALLLIPPGAKGQGTAFSFQGYLELGDDPANGPFNLYFTLYAAPMGGYPVFGGGPVAPVGGQPVGVTNGLFSVTLDFGSTPNPFNGQMLWLETDFSTNMSTSNLVAISRVQVLPVPYAIFAENGLVNGQVATGSGEGNVVDSSFSLIGGGQGNQVEIWTTCSFIGGGDSNTITGYSSNSFIGGGAFNGACGPYSVVCGGLSNMACGEFASVGGGEGNSAPSTAATVSGGQSNLASGYGWTFVGGGLNNAANIEYATVGGGYSNTTYNNGLAATIAGGFQNSATNIFATVAGGYQNLAAGNTSVIAGGANNMAAGTDSAIGGGGGNNIWSGEYGAVISGGINNGITDLIDIYFTGGSSAGSGIGSGNGNQIRNSLNSFIGGGISNTIYTPYPLGIEEGSNSTIAGGFENYLVTSAFASTISGGENNSILDGSSQSTIGGGSDNNVSSEGDTIAGGMVNNAGGADGANATVGGGTQNTASAFAATVAGGAANNALASEAFIGGGSANFITGDGYDGVISGGYNNTINGAPASVVAGGNNNNITGNSQNGVISGGSYNTNSGPYAVVPGGYQNAVSGFASFAAGAYAQATNNHAFVWSDGTGPTCSISNYEFLVRASGGVILDTGPGVTSITITLSASPYVQGSDSEYIYLKDTLGNDLAFVSHTNSGASGNESSDSIAMIVQTLVSKIQNNLAFATYQVTASIGELSSQIILTSATAWQGLTFSAFAEYATTPGAPPPTESFNPDNYAPVAAYLPSGSGMWAIASDKRSKANIKEVDALAVLEEVAAMPLSTWNYKTQDSSIRHIGPMAQDFRAAFGLGENATTIATGDEGGVALAAIQGLNQKLESTEQTVESKDEEIKSLKEQNDLLAQRLGTLEKLVKDLAQKK